MANDTSTASGTFIEAQRYSQFILENLHDGLLPETFYRDVSDFADGTTLNIKTVGTVTLQDVTENVELTSSPIDTGNITLTITDYEGARWHVTDELRQDGSQIDTLMAMQAVEATRAIQESHETNFFTACYNAQTADAANNVNGFAHRITANGAARQMELEDFIHMKLAFDKALAPQGGRIAIVDPVVEATINSLTNIVNVSNNPMFEGVVTEGFARDHKFVKNIFGWDIWTSNRLHSVVTAESNLTDRDGNTTATVAGDKANVFMCVADDGCRPMMNAWRQQPSVEGWRNGSLRRDEFQQTARYGQGAQRTDTLGIIVTSDTDY